MKFLAATIVLACCHHALGDTKYYMSSRVAYYQEAVDMSGFRPRVNPIPKGTISIGTRTGKADKPEVSISDTISSIYFGDKPVILKGDENKSLLSGELIDLHMSSYNTYMQFFRNPIDKTAQFIFYNSEHYLNLIINLVPANETEQGAAANP